MKSPDRIADLDRRAFFSRFERFVALVLNLTLLTSGIWLIVTKYANARPITPPGMVPESAAPPSISSVVPSELPPSQINEIQRSYAELSRDLHGETGLVVWPVGRTAASIMLGNFKIGAAWSTMKVPLSIAVLRAGDVATAAEAIEAAITQSDNVAADSLWQSLGDPQTAAAKVQDVLRSSGDDETVVQSERIHPPFSAFGQTMWTLENQTRFLASAACDPADASVLELMGRVEPDQRWGLGHLGDVRFKGGWGPSTSGAYLVRQMGLIHAKYGLTAVAIAAAPSSGSFDDGTKILTSIAEWLAERLDALPAGKCP